MAIINPNLNSFKSFTNVLRWAQSVYNTFSQGITFAQPTGKNSLGDYNKFKPGNLAGVMIRIDTTQWPAVNTAFNINHGLQRQPIGFIVCDMDAIATIYRLGVPTSNTIGIATSNAAVSITVFIF